MNELGCGCDPRYDTCRECDPPPCLGCALVNPLEDDLCESCIELAGELDAELTDAALAHFDRESGMAVPVVAPTPREPGKTMRIPVETMEQMVFGRKDNQ